MSTPIEVQAADDSDFSDLRFGELKATASSGEDDMLLFFLDNRLHVYRIDEKSRQLDVIADEVKKVDEELLGFCGSQEVYKKLVQEAASPAFTELRQYLEETDDLSLSSLFRIGKRILSRELRNSESGEEQAAFLYNVLNALECSALENLIIQEPLDKYDIRDSYDATQKNLEIALSNGFCTDAKYLYLRAHWLKELFGQLYV